MQKLIVHLFILLFTLQAASCFHLQASHDYLKEPPLPSKTVLKPRVVLVLGSGSARGFAHAGVLKVLEENHIPIDMIVGTSAGSIVGALYADKPSADALIHLLLSTERDEVIHFSFLHLGSGLFKGAQLQGFLNKNMKRHVFEALDIPFFAVATDYKTGEPHVFGRGPVAPAVNASSAVSPFFSPVHLYGHDYVDGGYVSPVAVEVAEQYHPKIIIAVSLDSVLSDTLPSSNPGIFLRSVEFMSKRLSEHSLSKASVVIRPQSVDQGMFDGSKREEQIKAGSKATYLMLPKIKALLQKQGISLKQ